MRAVGRGNGRVGREGRRHLSIFSFVPSCRRFGAARGRCLSPLTHNPRPTTHMHHNPRYLRHEASERQAASTQQLTAHSAADAHGSATSPPGRPSLRRPHQQPPRGQHTVLVVVPPAMFTNLTAGCKFAQREQRHLFQSEAKPESVPESALGSLDFFSGDEEAASAPAAEAATCRYDISALSVQEKMAISWDVATGARKHFASEAAFDSPRSARTRPPRVRRSRG